MTRPLRIEYPGAVYHVTSRGNRKEPIYEDDRDRLRFLDTLDEVCEIYNWGVLAYCLMGNHYHLVVETPDANLSRGMRHLNGVYTQSSNRRHQRVGHIFQGRFKAILVDADAYLRELSRYVVLNPVRSNLVQLPEQWRWSSYRQVICTMQAPSWLMREKLLGQFSPQFERAQERYIKFVREGIGAPVIWEKLNQQIYLGDDAFVSKALSNSAADERDIDIPQPQQREPAPDLDTIAASNTDRNTAIVAAYTTGRYSYREIGEFFGLHFTSVGVIVRAARQIQAGGRT